MTATMTRPKFNKRRWPKAPVLELLAGRLRERDEPYDPEFALCQILGQAQRRIRSDYLSDKQADTVAIYLGWNPQMLWGTDWDAPPTGETAPTYKENP